MDNKEILNKLIKEHESEKCCCDLTYEGAGFCLAGEYLNSCISLEDTLKEIELLYE